eukprot:TRINITY_DN15762_c0_g1_i1.p1 TRINITY_DN15762_c0_g1~~TRINITY_DN15762_c0_g1_i1.p1  ORF type:complete len:487 (+),score=49.01 TRINITY_DN15762_c0_g1_i1:81-1541(+)
MNSKSNPSHLQIYSKDTEAPVFWVVEQQKPLGNLLAALGAVAERQRACKACRHTGEKGRLDAEAVSAGIGFASIGLNVASTVDKGRESWQPSKEQWVPSITKKKTQEDIWEQVDRRLDARPALSFAKVSDALSKGKRERVEKIEEDVKEAAEEGKALVTEVAQDLRVPVSRKKLPVIGNVRGLTFKQLICGIISGAVAGTAVSPFEILRTRVVAKRGGENAAQVLETASRTEGLETFMHGSLIIATVKCTLEKGVQFATFEAVKRWEERRGREDPKWLPLPRSVPISTLAGAAAGVASTLVTYPFSALTDRTVLQPEVYDSLIGSVRTILKQEGVRGLYRGITPALLSQVPSAAATFYSYELLKQKWKEKCGIEELELWPSLVVGAAAGAISTTLTYPLEMARKQISMGALPLPSVGYSNMLQALREISSREGFRGLYRGLEVELVKVAPYTAISFAVYELTKRVFVAVGEERRDEVKDDPSVSVA